jgi:hypothetical protein
MQYGLHNLPPAYFPGNVYKTNESNWIGMRVGAGTKLDKELFYCEPRYMAELIFTFWEEVFSYR